MELIFTNCYCNFLARVTGGVVVQLVERWNGKPNIVGSRLNFAFYSLFFSIFVRIWSWTVSRISVHHLRRPMPNDQCKVRLCKDFVPCVTGRWWLLGLLGLSGLVWRLMLEQEHMYHMNLCKWSTSENQDGTTVPSEYLLFLYVHV